MEREPAIVSIIIPTYNCSELIEETLSSIMAQTYEHFECLIIDDHSGDNSVEVINQLIKNDDRFQLYIRPQHLKKGASSCRNYGFSLAKGQFIQWFDSDDIMHHDMLKLKVDAFDETVNFVVCQTNCFENTIDNLTSTPPKIDSNTPFIDHFTGKITFYTPGPMWSKAFIKEQNKLFDETLLNIQEWEFYNRLLLRSPNYTSINKPLIYYRKHANSIWGKSRTKEKIVSEYTGVSSIYKLANKYQKEIANIYFRRLAKLYNELKLTAPNSKDLKSIKKELKHTFFNKPLNLKDALRFILISTK